MVNVDGRQLIWWEGPPSALGNGGDARKLPHAGTVGLGADRASTTFQVVKMKVLEDKARLERPGPVRLAGDGGPIDLLKSVDPKWDSVQGEWYAGQDRVVSPQSGAARILVPAIPPEEYQVTVVAEPREGHNTLVMGLLASGRQFIALLDFQVGETEYVSGLENVDGLKVNNETTYRGKVLKDDGPSTIVYTVRKDRVTVECEGKTIIDFKGAHSRLSLNDFWKVPNKDCLFLGTYSCSYTIHKLELVPISTE
jgi:hypothetical protein